MVIRTSKLNKSARAYKGVKESKFSNIDEVIRVLHEFHFGRASELYLCLYNQIFAFFHYVFKSLTP